MKNSADIRGCYPPQPLVIQQREKWPRVQFTSLSEENIYVLFLCIEWSWIKG